MTRRHFVGILSQFVSQLNQFRPVNPRIRVTLQDRVMVYSGMKMFNQQSPASALVKSCGIFRIIEASRKIVPRFAPINFVLTLRAHATNCIFRVLTNIQLFQRRTSNNPVPGSRCWQRARLMDDPNWQRLPMLTLHVRRSLPLLNHLQPPSVLGTPRFENRSAAVSGSPIAYAVYSVKWCKHLQVIAIADPAHELPMVVYCRSTLLPVHRVLSRSSGGRGPY